MPTRRQIAMSILSIYRRQQARVGYILPARVIAALSNESGWSIDETEDGINYGQAEGWFTIVPHLFLTLTDGGFAEMESGKAYGGGSLERSPNELNHGGFPNWVCL